MKLSIFPKFGAQNSVPVFAAFKKGALALGYDVVEHDLTADVYVIWSVLWNGRMAANQPIWKAAQQSGKAVIVLEVGAIHRGVTWRIGLNHINNSGFFGPVDDLIPNRSAKLGIQLKSWTTSGNNILICGQHTKSLQWQDLPHPLEWLTTTINQIKNHTTRHIVVRPHPRDWNWIVGYQQPGVTIKIPKKLQDTYDDFDFDADLTDAWAVINPSSNTGILSILEGVPAFVTNQSLAARVGNISFEQLDNPSRPPREEWLEWFCHTEWTLEEIASGLPIQRIFSSKI